MLAIPAAPAMIGMLTHAPSRCLDGKIGSSPMNVKLPPVSSGESPSSCITERNSALMSKPADTFGVSNVLLVMMIPFNVVGLFGCGFRCRGCNSLAGSVFPDVVIAEAQRRPAQTAVFVLLRATWARSPIRHSIGVGRTGIRNLIAGQGLPFE